MGGTFNPIHKGHLALAKKAMVEFALDKVIFIPTGTPPHKKRREIINKEDRCKMVKLAAKGVSKFSVSRIELDRKGVSYAVDTFKKLKKKFGSATKLFYIMGLDSLNEILEWKRPLELFKLCEFIVATRPGARAKTFRRLGKIHLMELRKDISSSVIRNRLKAGKSVKRFLPKAVANYIRRNKLYQSQTRKK